MRSRISAIIIVLGVIFGLVQSDIQAQGLDHSTPTNASSIVFVVDTSGSMADARLTAVQDALRSFVSNTAALPIALVAFDDNVEVVQDFTDNPTGILAAADTLSADGASALYEATTQAATLASRMDAEQRVVILVTDGAHSSTDSSTTRAAALEAVALSGARIYTIGIGQDADLDYLWALADQSGGEMIAVTDAADITAAVSRIRLATTMLPTLSTENGDTAIVLSVDVSNSMIGLPMQQMQASTRAFVENINGEIPVAIVAFGDQVNVVEDFGTTPAALATSIDALTSNGVTALYDGALQAVQLAAAHDAANRVVVLLGDGAEYGGQSVAQRDDALHLALEAGVQVYTIGLGFGIDRAYLEELAWGTNGEFYPAGNGDELASIYESLSTALLARHLAASGEVIEPLDLAWDVPPLLQLGVEDTDPDVIDPLDAAFQNLDLVDAPVAVDPLGAAQTEVDSDGLPVAPQQVVTSGGDLAAGVETVITPDELQAGEVQPYSAILPVTIEIAEGESFGRAELLINGETLKLWDEPPYEYALDTRMLTTGVYELEFAAEIDNGGFYHDTMQFEVVLADQSSAAGGDALSLETESLSNPGQDGMQTVWIGGETTPLHLVLSQETGLTGYAPPQTELAVAEEQTLGEILASPFDSLPESIRSLFTQQHPTATSIIIILMAAILLPQGLFTIYWMTYSWVNAQRMERSGAPKEYAEPRYSFTALIPARREETVLYDTIMAVHNIDYPEHLKEILVLIRDDDDDDTIAAAERAIADINSTQPFNLPSNVRLITFADGPKNKPNGLNRGYREATKDVVCIFDAEDQPHEEVYHVVNTVMLRDGADVVQSGVQLMNFRSNWFSSFNVLEYFFWFKSGLHAFTHGLNVTPLGGNTVFFKKIWLDKLAEQDTEKGYRAWDEYSLTEDADVGIRLTSLGANIQIVYEARQATQEETPSSVEQFIKQRTRWSQGFYEIFFKFDWRHLPALKQRIGAIYILLNSLLQGAILFFLPIGLYIWATQTVPVIIAILSWTPVWLLLIQMLINLVGIREFTQAYNLKLPFLFRLRMMIYYYPFQLLLSISALRAMVRFITRQSDWEKTAHSNLHREASSATSAVNAKARTI